jgi:hypothetical protein
MSVMTLLFDVVSVLVARDQPFSMYSFSPFTVLQNGYLPLLVEPFQLAFVACGHSEISGGNFHSFFGKFCCSKFSLLSAMTPPPTTQSSCDKIARHLLTMH